MADLTSIPAVPSAEAEARINLAVTVRVVGHEMSPDELTEFLDEHQEPLKRTVALLVNGAFVPASEAVLGRNDVGHFGYVDRITSARITGITGFELLIDCDERDENDPEVDR